MRALAALAVLMLAALPAQAEQVKGLARVYEDASLSVGGTHVRLFGIVIPKLGVLCIQDRRGQTCSDFNAERALEDRISGFVYCDIVRYGADGVAEGICTIAGRDQFGPRFDLGAWLVSEGLAIPVAGAPPEYAALADIAKARDAGVWSGALVPELDDWN
jgi:endonuclease YncB( thermonuclease family)